MANEKWTKKYPCHHHVSESAESYGLGSYFGKNNIYKDEIQTKNFIGEKPEITYITGK